MGDVVPPPGGAPDRRPLWRRWRGFGAGGAVLAVGAVLQGVPSLLPDEGRLLALAASGMATVLVTLAAVWLEGKITIEREVVAPARRERLPPPSPYFTGHEELVRRIVRRFARFPRGGVRRLVGRPAWSVGRASHRTPLVVAVTGEGGTGKSELVAQVVAQVEDRFPDGKLEFQLYGDRDEDQSARDRPTGPREGPVGRAMRRVGWRDRSTVAATTRADGVRDGATAVGPALRAPRRPERVLGQMLTEVGGRPDPDATLDELSDQWRSATRHRRLLLVLDNAKDYAQVEPLLPKGERCAVLITSRNRLADAPSYVRRHPLGPLSTEEGLDLLGKFLREAPRTLSAEEKAELPGIVAACYRLPLAICLCGGQLAEADGPSPTELLERLRDPEVHGVVPGTRAIARSFAFSFGQCQPRERLLLGRLVRTKLTTFTPWAAAALLGGNAKEATKLLEQMYEQHLVTRPRRDRGGFDRYQLHDRVRDTLLALDARELGVPTAELADWSEDAFTRAVDRLLAAYAWMAERATHRAAPHEWSFGDPMLTGASADPTLGLTAPTNPAGWLDSERHGMELCFQWAGRRGAAEVGWRLSRALVTLCRAGRVYWADMQAAAEQATGFALEMGDRFAYAVAMLDRAEIEGSHGDHDTGYERALTTQHTLANLPTVDVRWTARAQRAAGVNLLRRGNLDEGRVELTAAERTFADTGSRWWRARTLCNLAELYRYQGHHEHAYGLLTEARAVAANAARENPDAWAGTRAKIELQRGDVLRLRGFDLHAWFVLDDARLQFSETPSGDWYLARCLRMMGQLSTSRLNSQFEACDLLLNPARRRDRRRQTAHDPRWPKVHRAHVATLFVDSLDSHAERLAASPVPWWRWSRPRLREQWRAERQIARLRRAVEIMEAIGDTWGQCRTRLTLGQALMDHDRAQGKDEMIEAANGFRRIGDKWWYARSHRRAAESLHAARRLDEALDHAHRAVAGYRGLRHLTGQVRAKLVLAEITTRKDYLSAMRVLEEAVAEAQVGYEHGLVPHSLLRRARDLLRMVMANGAGPYPHPGNRFGLVAGEPGEPTDEGTAADPEGPDLP